LASFYPKITSEQMALIESSAVFFVASADPHLADGPNGEGPVNLSPKGGVTLHVISPERVAFLDVNGSGNETARHTSQGGPITVMVCSFEAGEAAIVRLYGYARAVPLERSTLAAKLEAESRSLMSKPRQVIEVDVERTMTSCGYGVPVLQVVRERGRDERGRRYKTVG
jgi:hypothetical protein